MHILKTEGIDSTMFINDDSSREYLERWDDDEEMVEVCDKAERYIYPQLAKNVDDDWKLVINQRDGKYNQGVKIKTCSKRLVSSNKNDSRKEIIGMV